MTSEPHIFHKITFEREEDLFICFRNVLRLSILSSIFSSKEIAVVFSVTFIDTTTWPKLKSATKIGLVGSMPYSNIIPNVCMSVIDADCTTTSRRSLTEQFNTIDLMFCGMIRTLGSNNCGNWTSFRGDKQKYAELGK